MNTNSYFYKLSPEAIAEISDVCGQVLQKNFSNPKTVERATGIPAYVRNHRCISPKQLNWVRQNARHLGIPLSAELESLFSRLHEKLNAESRQDDNQTSRNAYGDGMLSALQNIEKLLTEIRDHRRTETIGDESSDDPPW